MTATTSDVAPRRSWRSLLSSPTAQDPTVELGPNWFASVMGTGILANAAATLPLIAPALRGFGTVVWAFSSLLLVSLIIAVGVQWLRRPHLAKRHLRDPVMAQFYGAAPMALMTMGQGTILLGRDVIGLDAAVTIDWVLWTVGTIGGLMTAVLVPFLLFTRFEVRHDGAFGGWLMPVVPPMVSAATGAALIPHLPAGAARETMLYGCYAMFGMSLIAALIIISMIWSRLAHFGSSGTARVPTLWIVLGPLGQSITAVGALGAVAGTAVKPELAQAMQIFAVLYGVPVWGFALLWAALATALTVRSMRRKMPFALTWWAFTFPVGTCVTGTSQLWLHTDLITFAWAAIVGYFLLLGAWLLVAVRTTRGAITGAVTAPPKPSGPVVASKG